MSLGSNLTPVGVTNFHNEKIPFGIKDLDRFNHIYVIGKTGTGKSTLLLRMAISDMQRGNALCLIDPHGDIAEQILDYVPGERVKDLIYFHSGDETHVIGFNPLQNISLGKEHLVVAGLIATFKKIWIESWGPRLEYILRFTLLTLCSYPDASLLDIQPLLTNYDFRKRILSHCTDQHIRSFWYQEFDKYSPQLKAEAISPILNKTGIFNAIAQLRNIVGQTAGGIKIQEVMDHGKILICNLAKGTIGEDATTILGSMIVNAIQLTAINRASLDEENRRPFYLYVDEMHSFVSLAFIDILAEARKYKLSVFLAHQYIEQIDEKVRHAVFGNVGTMIIFRVGAEDAKQLAQEVHPSFSQDDLINLPRFAMYLKLMIDGASSRPFSAETEPLQYHKHKLKQLIIEESNRRYGKEREAIENEIAVRQNAVTESIFASQTLFDS